MTQYIHCNGICLDCERIVCHTPNREVLNLTAQEVKILQILMERSGTIVTFDLLLQLSYPTTTSKKSRAAMQAMIKKIRKKLFQSKSARHMFIQSHYGIGYSIPQLR